MILLLPGRNCRTGEIPRTQAKTDLEGVLLLGAPLLLPPTEVLTSLHTIDRRQDNRATLLVHPD